jgi:nitrogen PTS system EIIA component
MEVADILGPDAVRASLKVQSKKRLFQEIAQVVADTYGLDEQKVLDALLERENLGPTGVGHGVAIPHARIPDISSVIGVFLRLDQAVDFESVDRKPVDLVFVLLAPNAAGAEHLKALARVSRTLRDETLCSKLRSTDDVSALYAILTETGASKAA